MQTGCAARAGVLWNAKPARSSWRTSWFSFRCESIQIGKGAWPDLRLGVFIGNRHGRTLLSVLAVREDAFSSDKGTHIDGL